MEKSVVSFTHAQNIICSQTLKPQLDDIAHEQAIIFRQLFAGHVVGSRPMKRKKNLHQIIIFIPVNILFSHCFRVWYTVMYTVCLWFDTKENKKLTDIWTAALLHRRRYLINNFHWFVSSGPCRGWSWEDNNERSVSEIWCRWQHSKFHGTCLGSTSWW